MSDPAIVDPDDFPTDDISDIQRLAAERVGDGSATGGGK